MPFSKISPGSHRTRRNAMLASCLAGPIALAGSQIAHAQQSAAPSTNLPTIVVSATATETPLDQVASSITVLTGKDLERDQRRTVPDALSTVPGLNVVQSGGPGGQTSIFMRGTNSDHTKVFIDGIDVTDPSITRTFDFGQLLTSDIDRIEVLRGPQSGLYGADSIGGVISIFTKRGEGPPRVTGTVESGSHGTFNQTAGLSGGQDRISYAFNVQHYKSTNTPVTPTELLPPGQQAIGNFYDNMTYSANIGVKATDNLTFNQVARYTDATLRFTADSFNPATGNLFPSPAQTTQHVQQIFTRTESAWSLFDGKFKSYLGVNYTNHWTSNLSPGPDEVPGISMGERVKFDWRGVTSLAPGQTLVTGLEQETERLNNISSFAAPIDVQNMNKAAYVELQSQFTKQFSIVSNIRFDDNDAFGGHTTYRIAPAYIIPGSDTKIKASYGTAFRAPTLTDLFQSFPPFFFANPNLKPEESVGYDAGFEQPVGDRFRFGATYFHNDIKNLIQFVDLDPAAFTSTQENIAKAQTEGVETFAALTVTNNLKLRGDYTYTRAVDQTTGLELLRRPKDKASLSAIWNPTTPMTVSATVLYIGSFEDIDRTSGIGARVTTPGYTIVNLATDYVINDHVKVFGRIDNLFDKRYQNPTGFLQPGFGIFGGVRVANFAVN